MNELRMRVGMLGLVLCLLWLSIARSVAQTAPAPTETKGLEEIVVTGSRIPVPANITSTSPLQVVTSQDIALAGQTDISDVLNNLPQNIIASGVDFGNTSSALAATGGFTTADLRGLGPQRTLVLVDGKRLGVGDPSTTNPNPAPDLDQIPTALIERVDVVTGGASATYGSDAIAGVINFIMKKNFEGLEISGQYASAEHSQQDTYIQSQEAAIGITPPTGTIRDGGRHDLSILMGTNFNDGAGNVTGYFVYHNQAAIPGANRDFADCDAYTNGLTKTTPPTGYICQGSENSNIFVPLAGAASPYTVVGNQFVPWPATGSNPPPYFNFPAYQYIQRQDERYQAGFMAHLDLNDSIKPYMTFSFMNDRTDEQVGPSGLFGNGNTTTPDGNYLINCSNPYLSAQEASIICTPAQIAGDKANPGSAGNSADVEIGRRNTEGGGRLSEFEHTNFRVVAGLQGGLGTAWSYDAYAQYYYTSAYSGNLNYINYAAADNALQATTNGAGQIVCVSGGSCVPWNIFKTGGVTPAQLAYLYTPGTSYGTNGQQIVHADLTGDLSNYGIQSPWARNGVGVNVGIEHRLESLDFAPDGAELQGDLAGFSGASVAIDQSYAVKEAFLEARAPIAQNAPGVYDLNVDAGYRYSDYSTAGVTNTYKFEVQYAPTPDLRARFSFDRAVRAPNLVELYNPESYGQTTAVPTDPCAPTNNGATHATASLAACEHTGVTAAEYGNGFGPAAGGTDTIVQCLSGQCGQVIGGNPNLVPEVADTWSLGLSITPTGLPNLTGSVDYYHILLEREVGTIPAAVILQNCLATGNPTYCSQIVRTPGGALTGATVAGGGYFLQNAINTGTALVSGIDLQLNYRYPLPNNSGTLSASLSGTWLQHFTSTPYPGAESYDCAGLFGNTCVGVLPTWRHNLRITWDTPWQLLLSAQWRFIGSTGFDNNSSQPQLQFQEEGTYDPQNARIANYSYLDLSAVWKLYSGIQLRAGVNNVFDKDPPFIPAGDITGTAGQVNSYQTYDLLGRELFVAFTAKF
jgi:outer membrane receptor protein involved in Fe transport